MHNNWDHVMKSSHISGQHLLSWPLDLQAQWLILLLILHYLTENRPDSILNPFSYNPCVLLSVLSHYPMDCSTPSFPVLHCLPEFAQVCPCPLSLWCHPTIWFSDAPVSSCPQSFPTLGSFPMTWLFTSGFNFNFSINPSNEYAALISFRID